MDATGLRDTCFAADPGRRHGVVTGLPLDFDAVPRERGGIGGGAPRPGWVGAEALHAQEVGAKAVI